ncbi:MAG: DUF523 and DUF1722 domain-containing protein [Nitrospira sp.]|nr:DUF523 and DUF1722 domain-containing protein [Nitrospira sp.]
MSDTHPIRIGISHCLLGAEVRFDGGHKRDSFLADTLSQHVQWVPVCPEVEAGFGTPREAMRLVGPSDEPGLVTIRTGRDLTPEMHRFSHRRLRELSAQNLSGFVFKKDSPSCGIERVRLYSSHGIPGRQGIGLFARSFMQRFPLIPVEEEGRLNDPVLRENFLERVFCYHRWQDATRKGFARRTIVQFHTEHKYLLLAHSQPHFQELGRMVGQASRYSPTQLAQQYGARFMEALKVKATVRKHVNVLEHILGHFTERLTGAERGELHGTIRDYHRGLTPLVVPLTLVKHYVRRFDIAYMRSQVYLNPHPKELMLRNHV